MESRPVRVAVVGAGPAGLFTAQALAAQSSMPADVDVLDRLPAPFGLVRYGVAPDHPGPAGVIGTNKADARETVASLLSDWRAGRLGAAAGPMPLEEILWKRGTCVTGLDGWLNIDQAELRKGAAEGRLRSKISDWASLNELAGAAPLSTDS